MTSWDIQPTGVQGVLTRTETVATEFDAQLQDLAAALEGGASNASSDIIAGAVEGFAASAKADIEFVLARTGSAMQGAVDATTAYVNGDLEMASNAQAGAAAAPQAIDMPGGGAGGARAE